MATPKNIIIPFPGTTRIHFRLSEITELLTNCLNGSNVMIILATTITDDKSKPNIIYAYYDFAANQFTMYMKIDSDENFRFTYAGTIFEVTNMIRKFLVTDYEKNSELFGTWDHDPALFESWNYDSVHDIDNILYTALVGVPNLSQAPRLIKKVLSSEAFSKWDVLGRLFLLSPTKSTISTFQSCRELGASKDSLRFLHNADSELAIPSGIIYVSKKNYKAQIMNELAKISPTSNASYLFAYIRVKTDDPVFCLSDEESEDEE